MKKGMKTRMGGVRVGTAPERQGERRWQSTRHKGWAGWGGRTYKALLRSFDFILQAMAWLLKILELVDNLLELL